MNLEISVRFRAEPANFITASNKMSKTQLVYFDSLKESEKGLQRSLIIFFIFWAIAFAWFSKEYAGAKKSLINRTFTSALLALLLASALGVQVPQKSREAILYGFCVGIVVSGSYLAVDTAENGKIRTKTLYFGIGLTILCAIIAFANFKVFSKIKTGGR